MPLEFHRYKENYKNSTQRGYWDFNFNIQVCPQCHKKFIPTEKSPDNCLLCRPHIQLPTYTYKVYNPKSVSISTWRKQHRDIVNKWKREHKQRNPDSVKNWNDRYRDKNRKRLQMQQRLAYKLKTMKSVNNHIIVKPEEKKEVQTHSGIILTQPVDVALLQKGTVVYVCKDPTLEVKKGEEIYYRYGTPIKDKDKTYDIVDLKEVLAIE